MRLLIVVCVLLLSAGAIALSSIVGHSPYQGEIEDGGFSLTVIDNNIDSLDFALVQADTGFTQLSSVARIRAAYTMAGL